MAVDTKSVKLLIPMMTNRVKVSLRLSDLANDLAGRGRRHDNSYSESYELSLLKTITDSKDDEERERCKKILVNTHERVNDYLPGFHNNDLSKMNMVQLLEFVSHKVCIYDSLRLEKKLDDSLDSYTEFALKGLVVSDDLRGVIRETILYFINKNESIRKNLPKEMKLPEGVEYVKTKEEQNI